MDVKLDMDRTWLKSTTLWGALVITVTGTLLYARLDNTVASLKVTMEDVRDELRKLVSENVSTRQSGAWLELFQLTLNAWVDKARSENPTLKIGDLKVPALPR